MRSLSLRRRGYAQLLFMVVWTADTASPSARVPCGAKAATTPTSVLHLDRYPVKCFLTVYNAMTWPRNMARQCELLGLEVVLFDNGSTYPPLLDWYATCHYEVIRHDYNGGCYEFWNRDWHSKQDGLYIASDSDLDLSGVPGDCVQKMVELKLANPGYVKIGLSLEFKALPKHFPFRKEVQRHEARFWRVKTPEGHYTADIGATFAMYDGRVPMTQEFGFYKGIRMARPYTARHLPWYLDPRKLTEEERFYFATAQPPAFWGMRFKKYLEENGLL